MPKRIDPHARSQQVHAAVRDLILDGGIEAVTIRAVADRAGLAVSSLRHGYRDKDFLLRCMIHECIDMLGRANLGFRPTGSPVQDAVDLLATQLPRDEESRSNALMLLALIERARSTDDDTRRAIRELRDGWRAMAGHVVRHLGVPESAQDVEAERLALLLEASLTAVCDPTHRTDRPRAIEILQRHVSQLRLSAAGARARARPA